VPDFAYLSHRDRTDSTTQCERLDDVKDLAKTTYYVLKVIRELGLFAP
jgi:hypothetical protein